MVDLFGLCSICGKSGPMHTCHLCGRLVCASCYDMRNSACKQCRVGKML